MNLVRLMAVALLLAGCSKSVLPPDKVILSSTEAELRAIVLTNAPIGMSRSGVERALKHKLHRQWVVVDYEARSLVAARGFTVPVNGGDYYFRTDLAAVPTDPLCSDVATVFFLFSRNHQLKDVAVSKWSDGP